MRQGGGEGTVRKFGIDMYTLLYLKWITNKVLPYSTGNSAQCYTVVWMEGEFGAELRHVYVCVCSVTSDSSQFHGLL